MVKVNKIAIVRVGGSPDLEEEVKSTLEILNLNRPNHCVIREDNPSVRGMLEKAKDVLTWGVVKSDVMEKLLKKRGRLEGGDSVMEEDIDEKTPYGSFEELAEAVSEGDYDLKDFEGLKEVFRLSPPSKGYNPTRRSFSHGGAMGGRGEEINDLLVRMI